MIEWSISLGSILILLTIAFSGVGFYWRQVYDSTQFKADIIDIKIDIKALGKVLIDMALQSERMLTLSKRLDRLEVSVDDLKHMKGFVS